MSDSAEEVNPDVAVEREMNNERARKRRLRLKAEKALKELEAANAGLIGLGVEVKPVKVEIREEEETVQVKETVEEIEIRPEVVQSRLEALGIEAKSKPQVEVEPSSGRRPIGRHKFENNPRRCVAHKKNGDRCGNWAIQGATICKYHGANKAVRAKARERIENSADAMARELLRMAQSTSVKDGVKLAAVRDALDRAGLGAKTAVSVEVEPKAYEEVFDSIYHGPRENYPGYSADATPALASSDEPVDAELVDLEPPERQPSGHQDGSAPKSRPMYYARMPQMVDAEIVDRGLVDYETAVGEAARVRPPAPRRTRR